MESKEQGHDTEADTFSAFVALGGTEDEDSFINSDLLIDTIKNQFKMTIDIEKLIEEVDDVSTSISGQNSPLVDYFPCLEYLEPVQNHFKDILQLNSLISGAENLTFFQDQSGKIEYDEFRELLQSSGGNDELEKFPGMFQF